jgi:carboxyl-terminal processing protease
LQDAVDMGGLFIKTGPIVQIKSSEGELNILEDRDPVVQYDGPLVIMVNTLSASASEILAAAIQDYKRGVIVGSNTFGKGTVQRIIDLDAFLPPEYENVKPLGAVKLTTQKFYRINGGATQLKGVTPDIILPDNYTYLEMGEKELEFPMPWDEIKPAKYEVVNKISNMADLKQYSLSRIKANPSFILEDENAHRLKQQSNKTLFTLNLEKYRQEQALLQKESKKYDDIVKEIPGIEITAPLADAAKSKSDSAKTEGVKAWHKNIKKDMYIYETVQVLNDIKP